MSFLGFIFAIFGFFGIIYLIFNKLFNNVSIKGWTSMIAIVLIVSGVQMLITSIIGEYVWRILDEVKNRPNYIIEEEVGFDEK